MPSINILPKSIAELIAAGEVVERPASVVKETVENAIDAGARHITVEINRGGITYIRITDDGCGIAHDDVPKAFMRHATSKIKTSDDLDRITTLGFRGEALAATAAVSRVEILTKTADSDIGTHYVIEGGSEVLHEEAGCPDGTTLIVRDLFYNTPARMKFLKKDATEGTAVKAVVDRAALSHPEISFKLIREGEQLYTTAGNGELMSAIYSVLGREFAKSLIEVNDNVEGITVTGYTCKPVLCRPSRSGQFTFLNGRLVNSRTVMAAVEQAYKNSAMVGKFPAFVLSVSVPYEAVDVNVHPAKTEVRFADEKRVFTAVHYAVKNAIAAGDTRPEIVPAPAKKPFFMHMDTAQYRQSAVKLEERAEQPPKKAPPPTRLAEDNLPFFLRKEFAASPAPASQQTEPVKAAAPAVEEKTVEKEYSPDTELCLVGEVFSTYIVIQQGESIFLIDKHAAHERILFNELKKSQRIETQALLQPVTVRLGGEEYTAAVTNAELLLKVGIELEDFGDGVVIVRAMPAMLRGADVESVVTEAAASLAEGGNINIEKLDDIFHTVACKAAIKSGYITSKEELLNLAKKVMSDKDVMYCPHGRPVAFEIKRRELEKHFGRIQ